MSYLNFSKNFKGVADAFMRDAGLYLPVIEFIDAVMTRDSELTIAEREMIAAYVSRQNLCDFCVGAHKATLTAMEIPKDIVDHVADEIEHAPVEEKFRQVLRFSHKLNQTGIKVAQADIDALKGHGWSEQAVEDAINVVALFNYVNRLVEGLGIEGTQAYFDSVGAMLAKDGYSPLVKMARTAAA